VEAVAIYRDEPMSSDPVHKSRPPTAADLRATVIDIALTTAAITICFTNSRRFTQAIPCLRAVAADSRLRRYPTPGQTGMTTRRRPPR